MPIGDRDWYREDYKNRHRRQDPPFKRVDHRRHYNHGVEDPEVVGYKVDISVTKVDTGVMVQNVGNVACSVVVNSPEGEQRFELAVSESITVTGITEPIEVSAVTL